MLLNKPNHRFEQIRRELVFHTHVFRHVVWNRLHRTSLALTHPSAHEERLAVKAAPLRHLIGVPNRDALHCMGFPACATRISRLLVPAQTAVKGRGVFRTDPWSA
jgi:hypothetical protein